MTGLFARCAGCGVAMDHESGRGKATKYCGDVCRRTEAAKTRKTKTYPDCSVEGCSKPATRKAAGMCETHYYRKRRTGMTALRPVILSNSVRTSADRRVIAETVEHSNGYLLNYAPDHPLSRGDHPRVYQHRVVYYERHGAGPFDCHWCQRQVTWETMHVDHVDDDKQNNDISNLVASCPACNQARGQWKVKLHHRRQSGIQIGDRIHTLNEWAAIAGISRSAIRMRLDKGWTAERAVFEPRGRFGPRSRKLAS